MQSDKEAPSNEEKENSSKEAWGPSKKPEIKLDIKQQQKEVEANQQAGDQWDETGLSKVPCSIPVKYCYQFLIVGIVNNACFIKFVMALFLIFTCTV